MNKLPLISIVIPVKNGISTIKQCLDAIFAQTLIAQTEVIIIDSGSTDGTLDIVKLYPVRLYQIPPETFNHGATRNYGVSLAKGELIFFTVQDAWLSSNDTLEKMCAHFKNLSVSAVVGHQAIPWGDINKNPAYWFKRYTVPIVETRDFTNPSNDFDKLNLKKQFELSSWDNVIAMYQKAQLVKFPFKNTNFSEDWLWANEVLKNNQKIIRDPSLLIYHYHHMKFNYSFKGKFTINYHFLKFFNFTPSINWPFVPIIKGIYTLIRRNELSVSQKLYWIIHNITMQTALVLSELLFHSIYLLGGKKMVDKIYHNFFCNVPLGRDNSTLNSTQ